MIPPAVLAECRERAQHSLAESGTGGRVAAAVIVGVWLGLAALGALWAVEAFGRTGVP
jgi:hypothetical protein